MPSDRLIPYGILWPGLLAIMLLYGLAWWLLWRGPARLHRHLRARAGRCLGCGYALHGLPADQCSEREARLAASAAAPQSS